MSHMTGEIPYLSIITVFSNSRYHFLLTQESKRLASSSEEVMLARLWDSTERQTLTREKEDVEAGNKLSDVPLLDPEKRQQYSNYLMINSKNETKDEELQHNDKKRKRSGSPSPSDENPKGKYPRGENYLNSSPISNIISWKFLTDM